MKSMIALLSLLALLLLSGCASSPLPQFQSLEAFASHQRSPEVRAFYNEGHARFMQQLEQPMQLDVPTFHTYHIQGHTAGVQHSRTFSCSTMMGHTTCRPF
jgi:outer membrane biogenesis lipoprotein LolB